MTAAASSASPAWCANAALIRADGPARGGGHPRSCCLGGDPCGTVRRGGEVCRSPSNQATIAGFVVGRRQPQPRTVGHPRRQEPPASSSLRRTAGDLGCGFGRRDQRWVTRAFAHLLPIGQLSNLSYLCIVAIPAM